MGAVTKRLFGSSKAPKPDPAIEAAQRQQLAMADQERARLSSEDAARERRRRRAGQGRGLLGYVGADTLGGGGAG